MQFKIIFVFCVVLKCVSSANILGIFPLPAVSHYTLGSKLMKGLAEAGHNVTVISPFELKDSPKNGKYTDVIVDAFMEGYQTQNFFTVQSRGISERLEGIMKMFVESTNKTLHHPNVKKILESNQTFDAVIMEQFMYDAAKVFSHIYDCPLITLSSIGPNPLVNPTVGNPQPVSYVPHLLNTDSSKDFTFFFRIKNLLCYVVESLITKYIIQPKQDQIIHEVFPEAPSFDELHLNVSLALLNSHSSTHSAVPLVPNMIEIGGYHIDPPQTLPEDLQDYLDNAKDGVVYFSMGSNLKSKDIPEEKRKAILNVLGKLKYKVLWKFEQDLPEKPSNVMIRKWLPQKDLLAHPNIKLFITHGGLLSTTEAIYHGKPILALPVFGDQLSNAAKAAEAGFGLKLDYDDPNFTEEKFGSLLNEILTNPKYRENAQRRSRLFHDRPQKPMDTAVYWVEYVIRHKGAPHLRVAGIGMPWYKYFMVDVIGVLVLGVYIVLYGIKLAFKKLFCRKETSNPKKIKIN